MKRRLLIMVFIMPLVVFFVNEIICVASPPPTEVEERKNEAPLHLIGTVTADSMFKDITKEEDSPQQIRKMSLDVAKLIKAPSEEKSISEIEVYYSYIPAWRSGEYIGGQRMDITVEDVIEIWLEKGENGWEPVLGGNTVEHLKYVQNRNNPFPEPFLHAITRITSTIIEKHTSLFVITILTLLLMIIAI
ncbi:MAG: hypothetical protein WB217_19220, partial [Mesobacillus sp.]|uniref:hypothetical protein n=1 Tax=Mesobacillus sp. TaxID=2675271 RepID=UPI003C60F764